MMMKLRVEVVRRRWGGKGRGDGKEKEIEDSWWV